MRIQLYTSEQHADQPAQPRGGDLESAGAAGKALAQGGALVASEANKWSSTMMEVHAREKAAKDYTEALDLQTEGSKSLGDLETRLRQADDYDLSKHADKLNAEGDNFINETLTRASNPQVAYLVKRRLKVALGERVTAAQREYRLNTDKNAIVKLEDFSKQAISDALLLDDADDKGRDFYMGLIEVEATKLGQQGLGGFSPDDARRYTEAKRKELQETRLRSKLQAGQEQAVVDELKDPKRMSGVSEHQRGIWKQMAEDAERHRLDRERAETKRIEDQRIHDMKERDKQQEEFDKGQVGTLVEQIQAGKAGVDAVNAMARGNRYLEKEFNVRKMLYDMVAQRGKQGVPTDMAAYNRVFMTILGSRGDVDTYALVSPHVGKDISSDDIRELINFGRGVKEDTVFKNDFYQRGVQYLKEALYPESSITDGQSAERFREAKDYFTVTAKDMHKKGKSLGELDALARQTAETYLSKKSRVLPQGGFVPADNRQELMQLYERNHGDPKTWPQELRDKFDQQARFLKAEEERKAAAIRAKQALDEAAKQSSGGGLLDKAKGLFGGGSSKPKSSDDRMEVKPK